MRNCPFLYLFFLLLFQMSFSQSTDNILLEYDVSGYAQNIQSLTQRNANNSDLIPTINSEMNVSDSGTLNYSIPIEVPKGINNHQPNLSIAYNSNSGSGLIGWGWNIVGLSSITFGGKNKDIDGVTIGAQYDGTDPFYLDGQRLIQVSSSEFKTLKYSNIIITRNVSEETFVVKFTDGKIATYKLMGLGVYLIQSILDPFDHLISYHYRKGDDSEVYFIDQISYLPVNGSNTVSVKFNYQNKKTSTVMYRNGSRYNSTLVLTNITVLAFNSLFIKYDFVFDYIQSNTLERLIEVKCHKPNINGALESLKPLKFIYNSVNTGALSSKDQFFPKMPNGTTKISDFNVFNQQSTDEIKPYFAWGDSSYKSGNGKFKIDGKITLNDISIRYLNDQDNDNVSVQYSTQNYNFTFPPRFRNPSATEVFVYGNNMIHVKVDRSLYFNDYNNDGLTDLLLIEHATDDVLNTPSKIYFFDFSTSQPSSSNVMLPVSYSYFNASDDLYFFEFNGDGIPDILAYNSQRKDVTVYKFDALNLTLLPSGIQSFQKSLTNFPIGGKLIFGDFNGDGLTDFIYPNLVFDLTQSTVANTILSINNSRLLWTEVLSTGLSFVFNQKDFTQNKLAYILPSQHNVMHSASFWDELWGGQGPSYDYSEFASSYISAVDVNNDGKSDLVSIEKVGKVKYDLTGNLAHTLVSPITNVSTTPSMGTTECYCYKASYWYKGTSDIVKVSHDLPPNYLSGLYEYNYRPTEVSGDFQIDIFPVSTNFVCPNGYTKFDNSHQQGILKVPYYSDSNYFINNIEYSKLYYQYVIPSSQVDLSATNKVRFHINIPQNDFTSSWQTLPSHIDLSNTLLSPFSILINYNKLTNLTSYKSGISIVDPLFGVMHNYFIDNTSFFEGLIRNVNNGSVVNQMVEYVAMDGSVSGSEGEYYRQNIELPYPYFVHKKNPFHLIVNKLHTILDDKVITNEYRYSNLVQHLNGFGIIGFQKVMYSDAYESVLRNDKYVPKNLFKPIFWKVKIFDHLLDNALISESYGSLDDSTYFTKTTITSQRVTIGNQYLILTKSEKTDDRQKGIVVSKVNTYNPSTLFLEKVLTDFDSRGSTTVTFQYQPSWNHGNHFFSGKIISNETSTFKNGLSFKTTETSEYNDDGSLFKTTKFTNSGTEKMVTEYAYMPDNTGNVKFIKTYEISHPDDFRKVEHLEYDETKRFVIKTRAHNGLESINIVDKMGRILISKVPKKLAASTDQDYFITSNLYDTWGNLMSSTDPFGITTTISKSFNSADPGGYYHITKTSPGSPTTEVTYDYLDRPVRTRSQTINNQWMVVDAEYDWKGRKVHVSDPYFEGQTPSFNTTDYDDFDRPIKQTFVNGRLVTTCYDKLRVTVTDGTKIVSKWVDAMGHVTKAQDAGGTIFYTYFPNGVVKETNYEGIKTTTTIDEWGRKASLSDPSAGLFKYEYDYWGRLKKETTPSQVHTIEYNNYDQIISELTVESVAVAPATTTKNYTYDPESLLNTSISGTVVQGNTTQSYQYNTEFDPDTLRIKSKQEVAGLWSDLKTAFTYDNLGRVATTTETTKVKIGAQLTDVGDITVTNVYDPNCGVLIKQTRNEQLIWELTETTAAGLVKTMRYGNQAQLSNTYDPISQALTHTLTSIKDGSGQQVKLVDINYDYDMARGILLGRDNVIFGKNETFTYDNQNRLLSESENGLTVRNYTYDIRGRMTFNSDMGAFNHSGQNYQTQSLLSNAQGEALLANRGIPQIDYNGHKNPYRIVLNTPLRPSTTYFEYNLLGGRTAMHVGSNINLGMADCTKHFYYAADKSIDIEVSTQPSGTLTKVIRYLTGDAYSANYMQISLYNNDSPISQTYYYIHRDNQGSILAISKADAMAASDAVVEQRFFDAWGNLRAAKVQTATGLSAISIDPMGWSSRLLLNRGYTGHEHLTHIGLVHMNGRLYHPVMRRFLSPDNYVQDPYNTQSYNRYGYVYNNPLMYTDPSGEWFFLAMGIAILSHMLFNAIQGVPPWYGLGKAVVVAAVMGGISFGIGSAANSVFGAATTFGKALFQAGLHGIANGLMNEIQGSSFISGFAAGAVSSLVSSAVSASGETGEVVGNEATKNSFGKSDWFKAVTIASGGLSGGISSSICGGSFATGFMQGVIVAGMNHLAHWVGNNTKTIDNNEQEDICPDCPLNVKKGASFNSSDGNSYSFVDGSWHLVGPSLRVYGADIIPKNSLLAKRIFPGSRFVGGASKTTSLASLSLRRLFTKNIGFKILGTNTLGGMFGRSVPILGEGLMIYDGLDFMFKNRIHIEEGVQARDSYIQQGLMPIR